VLTVAITVNVHPDRRRNMHELLFIFKRMKLMTQNEWATLCNHLMKRPIQKWPLTVQADDIDFQELLAKSKLYLF
jgi:hypothetical protein